MVTARSRTTRRLAQLVALVLGIGLAIVAGTLVRHHLEGPDPVAVTREATRAFAAGDCQGVRAVSFDPRAVVCSDVTGVREAYRDEGLEPDTFRYALVSSRDRLATVRIRYQREGSSAEEIVQLQRRGDAWKILASPGYGG